MTFQPGETVLIAYTGNTTRAEVIRERSGGWVEYRTLDIDGDTQYAGMVCEAASEYVYREGDERPNDPMYDIARSMGWDLPARQAR